MAEAQVPAPAATPGPLRSALHCGLPLNDELRSLALWALRATTVDERLRRTRALGERPHDCEPALLLPDPGDVPGRPPRPLLVPPGSLAQRSVGTREGRGALLHALAHIEFNAIGLALDHAWRFAGLPEQYYRDWIGVALEEAEHFELLRARLADAGFDYGDFPAHDGLWDMALRTADDVLARMAVVPRTLEARGLDASPAVREKFASIGDLQSAQVIDVILRDEVGHVAVGSRWFKYLCEQRGLDPLAEQVALARRHGAPRPAARMNLAARRAAGFSEAELRALGELSAL